MTYEVKIYIKNYDDIGEIPIEMEVNGRFRLMDMNYCDDDNITDIHKRVIEEIDGFIKEVIPEIN